MLHIGLTGGIGSGKSTVASLFSEKGAIVIDFDAIAHEVEKPGKEAWKGIVCCFGEDILDRDGAIDRKKLGAIVFADQKKLQELNSIVHPAIFAEWERQLEKIKANDPRAIVVADIPLLIEGGWQDFFDITVVVYVSPEIQIRRVMARNGMSRHEAEERLKAQMAIDKKIPFADYIINNEGSPIETKVIFEAMWKKIEKRSSS
ncbi:MAG: dephospho-CoA kinase [Syntrophales bacterium]|jgi:dephospho-CoA kinase|nr:dephospho-CoA kinase [Syntrophales bacterium]MDY0043248.1 dephospho-CoA kinase [Syntrophales bacterium]